MIKIIDVKKNKKNELKIVNKGRGRIRTISISKTRNRTAKIKKRRENGSREVDEGSNPHSKGEDFSRFILNLKFSKYERKRITDGIRIRIKKNIINTKGDLIFYNINVIRFIRHCINTLLMKIGL